MMFLIDAHTMIASRTITGIFERFEQKNIPYCVLRNYEDLPEKPGHDVDIFIFKKDFPQINEQIIDLKENLGWQYLFTSNVYPSLSSYILFGNKKKEDELAILHIDFFHRIAWHGIDLIKPDAILQNRIKYKEFYIIQPTQGAIQRLLQPLLNEGKIKEKYKEFIYKNSINNKELFNYYLILLNGRNLANSITKRIAQKDFKYLEAISNKIKRAIILREVKRNPRYLVIIPKLFLQKVKHKIEPFGLFVIVLGSDGAGKGAVIDKLFEPVRTIFINTVNLHWRPGLLPPLRQLFNPANKSIENSFTTPHSIKHKESSFTWSFLRWGYYTLDFLLGYYLKIRPMKIRETCIIFDRYYYDYLIDPIRYGFNLPQWLFKAFLPLIPKPDLTIYLDNTPEELYKRKQELPVTELKRQVETWREFIPHLPNPCIVTTDKPLEEVVNEVTRTVLETRAAMTRKTLKVDPDESFYLWKSSPSGGYAALPSKKNCRWIMPAHPVLAKKAWDLYLPYSVKGRLFKHAFRFLSSKGFLSLRQSQRLNLELADDSETLKKCLEEVFKREDLVLALSTGTPGPFRKLTTMVMDSEGKVLGYAKIGETPLAIARIKNEAAILNELSKSKEVFGEKVRAPEVLYQGDIGRAYGLVQSPAPFAGKSGKKEFNEDYAKVLDILIKNTAFKRKFAESDFYKKLKTDIDNYPLSFRDLLRQGLESLERDIGDKEITFSLSHGDFAPWNMLWNNQEVFLFDWESAAFKTPAGMDLVHFLFQTGFLLKKLRAHKLLAYIKSYSKNNEALPSLANLSIENLLLVYLLNMAVLEDKPQQLSKAAVERRNLVKMLIKNG